MCERAGGLLAVPALSDTEGVSVQPHIQNMILFLVIAMLCPHLINHCFILQTKKMSMAQMTLLVYCVVNQSCQTEPLAPQLHFAIKTGVIQNTAV